MADVATTKLMENDKVIVWEMLLEPGESTGMHTHEHSYIIQVLEGAMLSATSEASSEESEFELTTDSTYWVDVRDGVAILDGVSIPARHDAKNIGDTRYREILVEIK
jgi:beta-alanine degradation protein BauB